MRFRRAPSPASEPLATGHPRGTPDDLAALCATLGAVRFAIPRGYWCYLLIDASGLPFYAGITGNLLRRIGEHHKAYGVRLADVQVFRARTEHEARVLQFLFADRFDAHIKNSLGTAEYERYRAEVHRAAKMMDLPAHVTAQYEAAGYK